MVGTPLQGLNYGGGRFPRALPWAGMEPGLWPSRHERGYVLSGKDVGITFFKDAISQAGVPPTQDVVGERGRRGARTTNLAENQKRSSSLRSSAVNPLENRERKIDRGGRGGTLRGTTKYTKGEKEERIFIFPYAIA